MTALREGEDLLQVEGLRVAFRTKAGSGAAVDGVSFGVGAGETVALVGESGCGKSVTALSILRLLPSPPARLEGGSIRFDGRELTTMPLPELRRLRGGDIGMVFQEPMTALNPVLTVGAQLAEAIRLHRPVTRAAARDQAAALLDLVRIPDAARHLDEYPHRLSGGMRQRVVIAMALACGPRLLIADEPTTALDVTIQAGILDLLRGVQARTGMALLLITHNLGVVADMADRVVVMYAGRVAEQGPARDVLRAPRHPYTQGLLAATPRLPHRHGVGTAPLQEMPGMVPALTAMPPGCAFAPRCRMAEPACAADPPPLLAAGPGHRAACPPALRRAAA